MKACLFADFCDAPQAIGQQLPRLIDPQIEHILFYCKTRILSELAAQLRPTEPGFQAIEIRTLPSGTLTFVHCTYESTQGMIRVNWELHRDRYEFELKVQVPEGVPVTVIIPNGNVYHIDEDPRVFSCACPWR